MRLTREQNIVITAYGFFAAVWAGIWFHHWAAFFCVGFVLAFTLKLVNSLVVRKSQDGEPTSTTG